MSFPRVEGSARRLVLGPEIKIIDSRPLRLRSKCLRSDYRRHGGLFGGTRGDGVAIDEEEVAWGVGKCRRALSSVEKSFYLILYFELYAVSSLSIQMIFFIVTNVKWLWCRCWCSFFGGTRSRGM